MIDKIWKYTFAFATICVVILLSIQSVSEVHRYERINTMQDSIIRLDIKIQELKNTIENERANYNDLIRAIPDSMWTKHNGYVLQALHESRQSTADRD